MANTRAQLVAEKWIVENELPHLFGGQFLPATKTKLTWGGMFEFDAVSADGAVVVCISTSSGRTSGGNFPSAKVQKLKADAFYLLHATGVSRRVMAFTNEAMREAIRKEQTRGRFPPEIELVVVRLPEELAAAVEESRVIASKETGG